MDRYGILLKKPVKNHTAPPDRLNCSFCGNAGFLKIAERCLAVSIRGVYMHSAKRTYRSTCSLCAKFY